MENSGGWKLGFEDRWIKLVMTCVCSITYSVVINENLVGFFQPTRGIRQGDLISPHLFLFCVEAFSSLLYKAVNFGVISRVPTFPKGPRLSHILFANDSLLFYKANSIEWRRLLLILGVYEVGSGQKLNLDKTSIFFNRNKSHAKR
jgi:hypothetical protein